VEKDISVGACLYPAGKSAPNILFFHGNGEIVADYHDVAPLYTRAGINFLPVDYRGYGRSGGSPTVADMMRDCHSVFNFTSGWLRENGFAGPLVVMGRSLGSASALELSDRQQDLVSGMILESGFAYGAPLLELLGVRIENAATLEHSVFRHVEKIRTFRKPVLIIHAEYDHIIPFSDGQTLFDACSSEDKTLLEIPGANHNDIFFKGLPKYMNAVDTFCRALAVS
jgi:pimeloyl-ACP methyl ester carboxylesterase